MRPEHIHVLLNPSPVYGLTMGLSTWLLSLWKRNRSAQHIALLLIVISAGAALPVLYFGKLAYEHVRGLADGEGQRWLAAHMKRAESTIYVFILLAVTAILAALLPRKYPRATWPLLTLTILLSALSLWVGAWVGYAGGKVRHPEFRTGPAPNSEGELHQHEH